MTSENKNIRYPLSGTIARYNLFISLKRLSASFLIFSFLIFISAALEFAHNFSSEVRTFIFFTLSLAAVSLTLHLVAEAVSVIFMPERRIRATLQKIDPEYPSHKMLMIHDLFAYGKKENNDLALSAFHDLKEQLRTAPGKPNYLSLKKSGMDYLKIISAAAVCAVTFYASPLGSAVYRIANYGQDFTPAPSHTLRIGNISGAVAEKDTLLISCVHTGKAPDVIAFKMRYPGEEEFKSLTVAKDPSGDFIAKIADSKSYHCFFQSSETESDTAFVTVLKRPRISAMDIKIQPPPYTKLPAGNYSMSNSSIGAYKGSTADVSVKISENEPDTVRLKFSEGTVTALTKKGRDYTVSFSVEKNVSFSVEAVKLSSGIILRNPDSMVHRIEIIPDEHPVVNLIYPEDGHLIDDSMEIPVFATCADDFAVSDIYIFFRKLSFNEFSGKIVKGDLIKKKIPFESENQGISLVNTLVAVSELRLLPEDKIELFLRVYDNDRVSGPKFTDSKTRTVSLPSLEQLFSESSKKYDRQDEILKEEMERNSSVLEKLSELSEKLKKNEKFSFEDEMKIKNMIEDQKSMENSLSDLKQDIKKNLSLLDENSLLSEETMKKYMKLQDLADEIFTEDMKNKLKKLNEMQKMDDPGKDKMAELLKDFEKEQKKFGEEIEKSIEILQQIKNEYLLDKLIRQLDDIITRQNDVNNSLTEQEKQDLLNMQKNTRSSFEFFNSELKSLEGNFDKEQTENIINDVESKEFAKEFNEMSENISSSQSDKAKKTGTRISSKLLDTKNKLSDMKKQMMDKQKEELKKELNAVISDLLVISAEIEGLKNFSKDISSSSSHSARLVREISRVSSLFDETKEKIFAISKKTFFVDKRIIAKLGTVSELFLNVSETFAARNFSSSYQKNLAIMAQTNDLIIKLNDAADEIEDAQSPSGLEEMIKKMEEMARLQAQLNSQTSSMMNQSGEGMSAMQEMMNRLAMEQSQLYDALMKMRSDAGQPGEDGSPGKDGAPGDGEEQGGMAGRGMPGSDGSPGSSGAPKGTGEGDAPFGKSGLGKKLGDIGNEMKEAENRLKDKKLDEYLLSKQDRILEKLLDAVESAKREKYDNKRESRTGDRRAVDPGKTDIKFDNDMREMLIRSLKDGYTDKYKQKIKEYFRELEN
jgi:hypothetical protein